MTTSARTSARVGLLVFLYASTFGCDPSAGDTTSSGSTGATTSSGGTGSNGTSASSGGTGGTGGNTSSSGTGGTGNTTSASSGGTGGDTTSASSGGTGGASNTSTSVGVGGNGPGGNDTTSASTGAGGCTSAQDCPGTDGECAVRTCTGGTCGMGPVATGTLSATQSAHDCQKNACDGHGNLVTMPDPTDAPVPTSACVVGSCNGTAPVIGNAAAGTPCNEGGGKVCDGAGVCVACLADADCTNGVCDGKVCKVPSCSDGIANQDETDIDCGGTTCGPCATGKSCLADADCHICPGAPNPCVPSRCVDGTCGAQILYPGVSVREMTVDAESLYWTTSTGSVMTAPKDGSGPMTAVAAGQASPLGIAVDATQVYWTNTGDGTVMAAPLGASGMTMLASGLRAIGLVRAGGGFVWVMAGASLMQIPAGGGPAVAFATEATPLVGLAVDEAHVYWSTESPPAAPAHSACGAVHWATLPGAPPDGGVLSGGSLCRVSRLSGGVTFVGGYNNAPSCGTLGPNQVQAFLLHPTSVSGYVHQSFPPFAFVSADTAADETNMYWSGTWIGGSAVNKTGILVPNQTLVDVSAYRLVLDDAYLYMAISPSAIARTYK